MVWSSRVVGLAAFLPVGCLEESCDDLGDSTTTFTFFPFPDDLEEEGVLEGGYFGVEFCIDHGECHHEFF